MEKIYFKYNEQPENMFWDEKIHSLPNPQKDIQQFLNWFLKDYETDKRVLCLKDLYKIKSKALKAEEEQEIKLKYNLKPELPVEEEIKTLEGNLRLEACENFYELLMQNKIKIVDQEEEK